MRWFALTPLLMVPIAAHAQDVRALFDKVAAAYGASAIYVIRVQSSQIQWVPGADGPASRPNEIRLARSGKAMRYEITSAVTGRTLIWFTDGVTEWRYLPQERQYTESRAADWPVE